MSWTCVQSDGETSAIPARKTRRRPSCSGHFRMSAIAAPATQGERLTPALQHTRVGTWESSRLATDSMASRSSHTGLSGPSVRGKRSLDFLQVTGSLSGLSACNPSDYRSNPEPGWRMSSPARRDGRESRRRSGRGLRGWGPQSEGPGIRGGFALDL